MPDPVITPEQNVSHVDWTSFNARHCVGTSVSVHVYGVHVRTRTSSPAWHDGRTAWIRCRALAKPVPLRKVRVLYECWVRFNRFRMKNHWVHTVWEDRMECERACESALRDDDRIESYDIREDAPGAVTD